MEAQVEPLSGGMEVANRTVKSIESSLREFNHDEAALRAILESERANKARKTAIAAIEGAIDDQQGSADNTDSEDTMTDETSNTADVTAEQACEKLADILGENVDNYADKAELDGSRSDVVATAAIRKTSAGKSGYTGMFGACAVADCDRGCNTFTADTCDQHTADDLKSESPDESDGETLTVTIDGKEVTGDPETIKTLLGK